MRVLIAEDEVSLARGLKYLLEKKILPWTLFITESMLSSILKPLPMMRSFWIS